MSATEREGDGNHPTVEIDRDNEAEAWRYRCPQGHASWDRTNEHLWCPHCARAAEQGADVEPEFWRLHDKKTGEMIPWSAVELV